MDHACALEAILSICFRLSIRDNGDRLIPVAAVAAAAAASGTNE